MNKVIVLLILCGGLFQSVVIGDDWFPIETSTINEEENVIDKSTQSRSLIGDMASQLMSRQGTSQVLSLNLTNLFILVVLKALIYAAGTFGAGIWKGRNYEDNDKDHGRSMGGSQGEWHWPKISESEFLLFLGYLTGTPDDYSCLNKVACSKPAVASEYASGAKLMMRAARAFETIVPYDARYEKILSNLTEAIDYGKSGGSCDERYQCSSSDKKLNPI